MGHIHEVSAFCNATGEGFIEKPGWLMTQRWSMVSIVPGRQEGIIIRPHCSGRIFYLSRTCICW